MLGRGLEETSVKIDSTVMEAGAPPVASPARLGGSRLVRLRAIDWTPALLLALVVTSFALRLLWLDKPDNALIFDEKYYVNASRVILGLPVAQDDPYADGQPGLDPNTEHPPAAKLLIAASMRLLGDNPLGWRLPSVLFGTLAIPLLYGIVRLAGGAKPLALLATFLLAFDNLVFVHSRIATLDIFLVTLLLLGIYCYGAKRPVLAGLAFAAATLCKIQGLYGLGAIIGWEALRLLRDRWEGGQWQWPNVRRVAIAVAVYAVVFPGLLGALDSRWSSYKNPVAHIQHIFSYGFALSRPAGPQGDESNPWQWLVNEVPMTYLRTDVQEIANDEVQTTRASVFFRGAMNPYVIFITPLAVAFAAASAWKRRDDCSLLVLVLFAVTYLPFWPAAILAHRISYIFYFLPTLPAVAIGAAQLMYAPAMPRLVRWSYIGAVLLGFYAYFPFRQIP